MQSGFKRSAAMWRRQCVATAAVVGVVVVASSADAALTRIDYNEELNSYDGTSTSPESLSIDLEGDGFSEFIFTHSSSPVGTDKVDVNGKLTLDKGTTSQFVAIVKDTDVVPGSGNPLGNYAENLISDMSVGPGSTFISLSDALYDNRLLDSSGADGTEGGAFSEYRGEHTTTGSVPYPDRFIGFAFGDQANPNYGYIHLTDIGSDSAGGFLVNDIDVNNATVVAVVYESTPGVSVTTAVPEPAFVGLAAVGGLLALRRRRVTG